MQESFFKKIKIQDIFIKHIPVGKWPEQFLLPDFIYKINASPRLILCYFEPCSLRFAFGNWTGIISR